MTTYIIQFTHGAYVVVPESAWRDYGRATTIRGLDRVLRRLDHRNHPQGPGSWIGHARVLDGHRNYLPYARDEVEEWRAEQDYRKVGRMIDR